MGLFDRGTNGLQDRVRQLEERVNAQAETIAQLSEELEDARSQGRRIADIADVLTRRLANAGSLADLQDEADAVRSEGSTD